MGTPANQRIPGATYRLQFNRDFTFKQATQVVEYLHELGITDCYASPLFRAGAQSTHGYDICGFDQLNPNLGSREEFDQFSGRLRELGMGLVLDIVPNHMGNDVSNRWWRSVLEKGRASPYGTWFDIDWQPPQAEVRDKVVLPILEDHYAKVLEAGKLRLVFEGGEFAVAYYDRRLPLSPESYALVLKRLPLMEDPKRALAAAVENFNGTPGMPRSFDKLHGLLEQQHYRLVYWRAGPEAINYRRFFDVTELVSLRMELPEVFEAAHALVFELVQAGQVTGLRVDHPDGLWNPRQYFERLQASAGARLSSAAAAPKAPVGSEPFKVAEERSAAAAWHSRAPGGRGSLYVVAEKILTGEEELPVDWAVEGTTGYDFLNRVNGLFVDSAHGQAMERCYAEFIGERSPGLRAMVRSSKRQVLETSLVGELNGLASRLKAIAGKTRYGQDFTCQQIRECLAEVIAALPVYRTYITEESSEPAAAERGYLLEAIRKVRSLGDGSGANAARGDEAGSCRTRRKEAHDDSDEGRQKRLLTSSPTVGGVGVDAEVLGFLERLLLLRFPEDLNENGRQLAFGFIMRFQQVTGPVMAKGLEDTAFYRYNRLISLNEVGGDPDRFGVTLQEFHEYNSARAESWPHSLLATATHDTKRGEDARARLDVLSEMPAEWERAVTRWRKLNAGRKTMVAGRAAPQANEEYLLYQTLVGAWEG